MKTSRLPGFYKLAPEERLRIISRLVNLEKSEVERLSKVGLTLEEANRMIENVIGIMPIPLGIATNFIINGREYLIPMAIEEPSVVAAASNAAKMARPTGGFRAKCLGSVMIGQVQIVDVPDPIAAEKAILDHKMSILNEANRKDPLLVSLGGGAKDLRVKQLETPEGLMLVVELLVDCKDAMGANIVNTMAEAVAPTIERLTGGTAYLRIVSNLAIERLTKAEVTVTREVLGGKRVVDAIVKAWAFAEVDPFRAATHNKGIMNGIVAVLLATGNDTRAVEAAAHAYASITGRYKPLTRWERTPEGNLRGTIELPLPVGIVGGATHHPIAKIAFKILGVRSALEFAEVLASVGLAQNLAALKALVTEGICAGHMRLHARNIAMAVGATGDLIDLIAERMIEEGAIRYDRAKELLRELSARAS